MPCGWLSAPQKCVIDFVRRKRDWLRHGDQICSTIFSFQPVDLIPDEAAGVAPRQSDHSCKYVGAPLLDLYNIQLVGGRRWAPYGRG